MRKFVIPLILLLLFFVGLLTSLDAFPSFSWDEGWTVTVARTWVERGYYAMWLDGQPTSPRLAAAFPSVISLATAFQVFGIGLWQARFVVLLYMMGALAALYALTRSLYSARAGVIALLTLVLLLPHFDLQALYAGRQVVAEPLMLFFLLVGFFSFLKGLETNHAQRRVTGMLGAIGMWSLALSAKAQPLPFWIVSLLAGVVFCVWQRRWRDALLTFGVLGGSLLLMRGWTLGLQWLLGERLFPSTMVPGLLNVTAVVPVLDVRIDALIVLFLVSLPLVIGLCYVSFKWFKAKGEAEFAIRVVQCMVLAFVWSWTLWYLLLSIGWARYFFPATFVSSMFVGVWLDEAVVQVLFRPQSVSHSVLNRRAWGALGAMVLCAMYIFFTISQLLPHIHPNVSARATTVWLNANIAPS